jgi:probable rRNA maturation factor
MFPKNEILLYNLTNEKIPPKRFFQELINEVLVILKEKDKVSLSLVFITPQSIRQLNKFWRHKNKTTTVLSFPLTENLPLGLRGEKKSLGDIFLCPWQIKSQAQKLNIPLISLYRKLIIHSLLHLYGYDHSQIETRQKMERLEDKIFRLVNK